MKTREMSFWYNAKESDLTIPFFQEFLGSVEELTLWSSKDVIVEVPYVILYNIVTRNQPRLKHLKVCDDLCLEAVFMLFATHEIEEMPFFVINKHILVSRIHKPYRLESITISEILRTKNEPHMHSLIAYQQRPYVF